MTNIKRLLNKESWTGQELGKLLLANTAHTYKEALKGNYKAPAIFNENEFNKMLDNITTEAQAKQYKNYYAIDSWIRRRPAIASGFYLNGQSDYLRIENALMQANFAEEIYIYMEQLPAIMTEKEYDEIRAKRIEEYFIEEDGAENHCNIFDLIARCIDFNLDKLEKHPTKPNILKTIKKKYLKEPVKSNLILSSYNELYGNGYYTIGDKRSDQMSQEEWEKALEPLKEDLYIKDYLTEYGENLASNIAFSKITDKQKVIFADGKAPIEWHTYQEPPEELNKWDIIEQGLLPEIYGEEDGKAFNASMQDFYNEYKELINICLEDMEKNYKYKFSKLPIKEWEKILITRRELYKLDFYGEQARAESDRFIFDGNKRALFNGIAIIRPSDLIGKARCIDDTKDNYREPNIDGLLSSNTLEAYFTEAPNYAYNVESMEDAREGIKANLYYLQGYNKQIDLTIELTGIKELEIFKERADALKAKIDRLNRIRELLYKQIKDTDYKDKELQRRKLEVLEDIFPPIEYKESLTIPEENIAKAKEIAEDFTAYKNNQILFDDLLCYYPEDTKGAN